MFSWARWLAVVYPGLFPTLPQVVAGGLEPEWGSFHPCLPTFFCKEAATAVLLPQCSLIQSPRMKRFSKLEPGRGGSGFSI